MDINALKELSGYSSDPETICLRISGDDAGKFLQGQFENTGKAEIGYEQTKIYQCKLVEKLF